ncbi:MAG: DUF6462 family protein [Lachnospiraceae bacterium]|nr:DUF6462 family protein [Lachnospiraceae bacterium]
MKKIQRLEPDARTGKIEQACMRYGLGRNTMHKVADEAGAVIRIGKCYLVNYAKVDAYMDKLSGAGGVEDERKKAE